MYRNLILLKTRPLCCYQENLKAGKSKKGAGLRRTSSTGAGSRATHQQPINRRNSSQGVNSLSKMLEPAIEIKSEPVDSSCSLEPPQLRVNVAAAAADSFANEAAAASAAAVAAGPRRKRKRTDTPEPPPTSSATTTLQGPTRGGRKKVSE